MKPIGIKAFAEAVGVNPQTARRLADLGVFRCVRDFRGWRRFSSSEISRARKLLGWQAADEEERGDTSSSSSRGKER